MRCGKKGKMANQPNRCSEEYTPKHVIERKLLLALNDSKKVAILLEKKDLSLLIKALHLVPPAEGFKKEAEAFAQDLNQLRLAAFYP